MHTLRDLQYRGSRFVAAIIGTAVVFTMLFLMTGLNEQFHREPRVTVDSFGAGGWILRDGASGPFTSAATIPEAVAAQIPGGVGVPVVTGRHSITRGGEHIDVVVVGYRDGELGEPALVDGRLPKSQSEAVVDESADLPIGATATLGASSFRVVGHTRDTTLLAGMPLVQMRIRAAQQLLYRGGRFASAVLVPERVEPPEGYTVLSNDQVADDVLRPLDGAVSSVNLIRILLWFVAAMIIGTLVYLSAMDRRRDVAVLKAVGGGTVPLAASIALQGVMVALIAVGAAAGLQAILGPMFPLKIVVPGDAFVQLPVIAVGVALLAGAAGLRKAVGTDPALAFSGADR
jgi:putative ABC transport system permease protein